MIGTEPKFQNLFIIRTMKRRMKEKYDHEVEHILFFVF